MRHKKKPLPVVDNFHIAVLFNPQFTDNYIMYTAKRVRPCVCLFMPVRIHTHTHTLKSNQDTTDSSKDNLTHTINRPFHIYLYIHMREYQGLYMCVHINMAHSLVKL